MFSGKNQAQIHEGPHIWIEYETKHGLKRAEFYHDGFRKSVPAKADMDTQPDYKITVRPKEVIARFMTGYCELCCKNERPVLIHQVKRLKDLSGNELWEQFMLRKHRKTLGIFFNNEETGGQTIVDAVREINQEYSTKLEELKSGATYDQLSMTGVRTPWSEVLAVYAVKTTSDPTNGQEVVTMDDGKKDLLKLVFWDMNQFGSFTSTVPGEGNEEDTTTLYITLTAKTADEMADVYGFNTSQRQQLAELLSDEYQELWNSVLYGIGTSSGEIVAVALSQVGNVGGQPYWSWYGFNSRVDWCAIFVSWCADQCGYIEAGVVPRFAGCVQGSRWFKERGLWQDRSYTPNPGDIIFFDWHDPDGFSGPQDGVPDHVGIVEKVENGRVFTVEGNSGDRCCQRSYAVAYYEIYGYGENSK